MRGAGDGTPTPSDRPDGETGPHRSASSQSRAAARAMQAGLPLWQVHIMDRERDRVYTPSPASPASPASHSSRPHSALSNSSWSGGGAQRSPSSQGTKSRSNTPKLGLPRFGSGSWQRVK
eukprot:Tamp_21571.p1 GENE.Tamp_21571~~Tamp_21571.p1  ORF type:complete len:120 (-),score=8.51 Tamp_21571:619-978(-)